VDRDAAVRFELYRRFVEDRRAPTHAEVGETLGLSEEKSAESFRRLADSHVIVLEPGTLDLRMAAPLSAVETPFRVETSRGEYHGNCAWDALGVIAMLGTDGGVATSCGDCGERLEMRVAGGALEAEGVAHFLVPASHWWDDIGHT
jgi:alkylmercury lyase-like protein